MFERIKFNFIKNRLKNRTVDLASVEDIEQKHTAPTIALFNDSSYFNGISDDGSYLFTRQSFRTTRGNEYWFDIFFPDLGLLSLKKDPGEEKEGFQQGVLLYEPIELGKKWRITFRGDMDLNGDSKKVEIDLLFTATTPIIDFQNAMIVDSTAAAIAEAKWSRSFFNKLKDSKKQHFEQGGRLVGSIVIDGVERTIDFTSMRDHSWGTRDWAGWNRHIWMSGMMENGQAFNASMVKYDYMGQLSAGFITNGDSIHYLREFSKIDSFASDPIFPKSLDLRFRYTDGKEYHLQCERRAFVPYNMDDAYLINEAVSIGTVNGIPIKMVTEYGFNMKRYDLSV